MVKQGQVKLEPLAVHLSTRITSTGSVSFMALHYIDGSSRL